MAGADFVERGISGSLAAAWDNSHSDFTVSNLTYDANGNILTMKQWGNAVVNGTVQPVTMDDLSYSYQPASNTLDKVEDAVSADYSLNDFINGHTATTDYSYDADGNLKSDANKGVSLITYNPQDLPTEVQGAGGHVANTYDASGSLLEKKITPATGSPVTYRYIGPIVFKDDDVEYALHSEGRARWVADSLAWRYDYFVKDHLGNVRTIVTKDEGVAAQYLVTYENDRALIERSLFEKVDEVREDKDAVPGGTVAAPGSTDTKAALLDGSDPDRRIGTSLLLKVMAGDKFKIGVEAAYDPSQPSNSNETVAGEDMLGSLISALSGSAGGTWVPGMEGGDMNPDMISGLLGGGDFLTGYGLLKAEATDPQHPKAYLSYVLLDEDMHVVKEESGVLQVGAQHAGAWGQLETDGDRRIGKNGYLVVFLSNEDMVRKVGYDNLLVTYSRGRLLEEQHYYPHGLVAVDGVHNPLANRYLYQGKELQDEAGLQLYDFHARQYDPQIGRFWGIDPMDEFPSGYTGMGNDPANLTDPSGMSTNWEPRSAPIQMGFGYSSPGTYDDGGMTDGAFDFDGTEVSTYENSGGGQGGDEIPDTDVYTKDGKYVGTVNDNLPNQVHFANASYEQLSGLVQYLNGLSQEKRDEMATNLRGLSLCFIGMEGAAQLKSLAMIAAGTGAYGTEIPFYATISKSRQLNFTSFSGTNGTSSEVSLKQALERFQSNGGNINSTFGTGHPHIENWYNGYMYGAGRNTMSPTSNMEYYYRPTRPEYDNATRRVKLNDYNNVYNRTVPLFINSPVGVTIYNTNSQNSNPRPYFYKWFYTK